MPLLLLFFSDAPILISAYRISALKWEYRYWYFCRRLPILPDIFSRPRQIGFAVNVARLFQAEEEKQQGSSIQVTLLIIWKQITSRSISNIGKVMTFPKRAYPKQQLTLHARKLRESQKVVTLPYFLFQSTLILSNNRLR